jgi:hypothetical protein
VIVAPAMADDHDLVAIAREFFTATTERDWDRLVARVHEQAELELRSQRGRVLHGRAELEEYARSVIGARRAHEISADTVEQVGPDAVVALGRLFVTDERGWVTDTPCGWLMLFEDGYLRRSYLVDSVQTATARLRALERDQSGQS